MVAHALQLDGGSHQIQLMQTGYVALESFLGARLQVLMHQGVVYARGTLARQLLQSGIVVTCSSSTSSRMYSSMLS